MQIPVGRFSSLNKEDLTFEHIGRLVRDLDLLSLEYDIPDNVPKDDYYRKVLCDAPVEVVLLYWPPGAESAIHWHEGFWGYVAVLKGGCENVEYTFNNNILIEEKRLRAFEGGVVEEKDGVIHKLVNPSKTEAAVTLHFYCPPIHSFENMKIFDVEHGRIGTLGRNAKSASWSQPADCFKEIEEDAFEFRSYEERKPGATHRILPIVPKPESPAISKMLDEYYREQASSYDHFDTRHDSRKAYTEKINNLVADALKQESKLDAVLTLACGTGRRALDIRKASGRVYRLVGVDLSNEMVSIARSRGVDAIQGNWINVLPDKPEAFDAATFLYAFGHLPTQEERLVALKKINQWLRPGGKLFLDVFNVEDDYEWGPNALKVYKEYALDKANYEKGDVFYKKAGGEAIAYLHYFSDEEISDLLEAAGFKVNEIYHIGYVKHAGEILDEEDGTLFIVAEKQTN